MKTGIIRDVDIALTDALPGGRSGRQLAGGDVVEILGTWHRVRLGDQEGFIPADAIRPGEDGEDSPPVPESTVAPPAVLSKIDIQVFRGSAIIGDKSIECDSGFSSYLTRLDSYASQAGVGVFVTHSLRQKDRLPIGAIVPPAKRSNHLVGHAIDMNIFMGNRNPWFNSKKLKRSNLRNLPLEVRTFIDMIRDDDVLRWGGDFVKEDPVHIDDNLYGRAPDVWMKKFEAL